LYSFQERIIIFLDPLEYADAEQLADVLAPFLSPQGNIAAYSPTNTLIIKRSNICGKKPYQSDKRKTGFVGMSKFSTRAPATNQQIPPELMYQKYGMGRGCNQKEG
jgi:hypothetical protein